MEDVITPNSTKSVYDFHDGSDRDEDGFGLRIDENPTRTKKHAANSTGSLKMRLPGI